MSTTKIYLEIPNEIHLKVKGIQLERENEGQKKVNLKELYIEVLANALLKSDKSPK